MKDITVKIVEHGSEEIRIKFLQPNVICLWPELKFNPVNLWNAPTMLTSKDIRDRLKHLPEIDLLEVLEIDSEEIVDRFDDKIDDKEEILAEELADFPNGEYDE